MRSVSVVAFGLLAGCNLLSGVEDLSVSDSRPSEGAADTLTRSRQQADEDGGSVDGDSGESAAQPDPDLDVDAAPPKRVFVTSVGTNGNLGGTSGADERCTSFAANAGLGGRWVAWLSVEKGPYALERLTHNGPWYLVNGTLAVRSRADLQKDSLANTINVNERGGIVSDGVWTGTQGGRYALRDCSGWTTSFSAAEGTYGSTNAVNATWTSGLPARCNVSHRLYCFEN